MIILILISLSVCIFTWYYFFKLSSYFNNGGELVASVLKSHGVNFVFTLTGGHISPILTECKKKGIQIIDTRNEATAAFAADGVSRLTDQIGVAVVTAGPGVTNTITALRNAQMGESPLLLIGGAAATLLKGKGSLQDVEQINLLKNVCKKVFSCTKLDQIQSTIKKAIYLAKEGIPGPVFVEIPIDLLYSKELIIQNAGLNKPKKSLFGKMVDFYISMKINRIFAKSYFYYFNNKPKNIKEEEISSSSIFQAEKLIFKSSKPIIVVGSQVINQKLDINNFVQDLIDLRLPVYLSSSARGLFSDNYDLQFYHNRSKALRESELIILLGISCDFRLDYGKVLNKNAKIISVNINKKALYLNQPLFWKANLSIHGNPVNFINQINIIYNSLDKHIYDKWINTLKEWETIKENKILKMSEEKYSRINPIKLCKNINKIIKKKTIVIVDGGDFASTAAYTIKPKGPLQWMDPGPFGTLGVGAGFALAAKLCKPNYDVIIIYGDGAAGYSLVEYDTFKRHDLNIVSIIGNDACWSQILREQIEILKDDVACNLGYSDYHKIGESFDCQGYLLKNNKDLEKLPNILNNINQPMIINCLISKTDFRKGSISV